MKFSDTLNFLLGVQAKVAPYVFALLLSRTSFQPLVKKPVNAYLSLKAYFARMPKW